MSSTTSRLRTCVDHVGARVMEWRGRIADSYRIFRKISKSPLEMFRTCSRPRTSPERSCLVASSPRLITCARSIRGFRLRVFPSFIFRSSSAVFDSAGREKGLPVILLQRQSFAAQRDFTFPPNLRIEFVAGSVDEFRGEKNFPDDMVVAWFGRVCTRVSCKRFSVRSSDAVVDKPSFSFPFTDPLFACDFCSPFTYVFPRLRTCCGKLIVRGRCSKFFYIIVSSSTNVMYVEFFFLIVHRNVYV